MKPKKKPLKLIAISLCLFMLVNAFAQSGSAYAAEDPEIVNSQGTEEAEDVSSSEGAITEKDSLEADELEEGDKNESFIETETEASDQKDTEQHEEELSQAEKEEIKADSAGTQEIAEVEEEEAIPAEINVKSEEAAVAASTTEESSRALMAGDAASSTNLADFLVSVECDAPIDENGNYIINPNSTYEVSFSFREDEDIQFENDRDLTYTLPEGLIAPDIGATSFDISIVDGEGSAVISGNTYEVADGVLTVRFNQNDTNINRLKALANVAFMVQMGVQIDENVSSIVFNSDIEKEFVFETNSDLTIDKSVSYDMDADTASYEITVKSYGYNENVSVQDVLTGTALTLNRDVTVESSIHGTMDLAVDYESVSKGFVVAVPSMENNEVLTIRCSASVDNNKISSNGTVEQTGNTARVTSDQVPDGKEASADFKGQADFQRVAKDTVGEPVQIGENLYVQTWRVRVNEDHKLDMGGSNIDDWILTNSRPFMFFNGEGLTVNVTFENGTTQTRVIPWSDLYLWQTSGNIWGWRYTTPNSDGKAAYEITCTTLINSTGALGDLTLINGAQVFGSYDEAQTTVGIIGENVFNVKKDAIGTTSKESEWKITVTVPGSGVSELHVTDDCPSYAIGDYYMDLLIDSSMEVDGLIGGESWKLEHTEGSRSFTVQFYKTGTQDNANTGVLPTEDGQPRDIVIRFKTQVNQEWLDKAAEEGYVTSSLFRHRNYASAWSGSYRTPTVSADVIPIKPELLKNFAERSEADIDGVTYPVFRYTLSMMGPTVDGIVINDSFDTEYLEYYEIEGVKILGGNNTTPTDGNGVVFAQNTQDGMRITVSSFPKQGDGNFYPYYLISYSLIVKDQEALNALNNKAAASQGGVDLENTAAWDDIISSRVVNYTYFPYVDKEILETASTDNGYVAEFKLIINQYAEDLDPASDTLNIQDELSPNLRLVQDSISISPSAEGMTTQFDSETNTLSFTDMPDNTRFEITYRARVLGKGNVTYSNTVKLGDYEKTVEEEIKVESSGAGTGSNPSITLVKRDSEDVSSTLAGATFQLFYLSRETQVPVTDKDGNQVQFTTGADGTVMIAGNQQELGWTLWEGRTYRLVEISAPVGYVINETPTEFIVSSSPSSQLEYDLIGDSVTAWNTKVKTEVPVTKTWVGKELNEVTVRLYADGEEKESAVLTAGGEWKHVFGNLPKYDDQDGHEIEYTVTEDAIEGYNTSVVGTGKVSVPVKKAWIGPETEKVTVNLLADGEKVDTVELSADNEWQHVFEDLEQYKDGEEIEYTVEEVQIENYSSKITGDMSEGYTITNTNVEKVEVPVTKTWVGKALDEVIVRLYADGKETDSAVLTADGEWKHVFVNLAKYDDQDGHEIEYTVTDTGKVSVPVKKAWIGPETEKVTVNLLADGEKVDTVELSAENDWQHLFAGMEQYKDGVEIKYTIQEIDINGYDSSITGTIENGFTITNVNIQKFDIPVIKKWVGEESGSVTIRLYADEIEIKTITLSKENNWQDAFSELPVYDSTDGHEIKYSITEDSVEGYFSKIEGDQKSGYTVTNTKEEKPKKDTPSKPSKQKKTKDSTKTGDSSNILLWAVLLVTAGALLFFLLRKRNRRDAGSN